MVKQDSAHRRQMLQVLWCAVVVSVSMAETPANCAHFEFPKLSSDLTITASEYTEVSIPFKLVVHNASCLSKQDSLTRVYVSHDTVNTKAECIFQLKPGGCRSVINEINNCLCDEDNRGGAAFRKNVTRANSGSWWFAAEGIAHERQIVLNIEYQTTQSTSETIRILPSVSTPRSTSTKTTSSISTTTIGSPTKQTTEKVESIDDGPFGGALMLGLVIVGANVITTIFVAVVIFLCLRRRARKKTRRPQSPLPPVPPDMQGHNTMSMHRRHSTPVLDDVRHTYDIARPITPPALPGTLPRAHEASAASADYLTPVKNHC
ncbi:uncharacterized protein [Littorina saxatilis]|uniref:Uncharacterized protein n=1 Tax=Littorina saxatilis TaxID=31220 RepID=A0AAN9G010_9CAEN